MRLTLRILLAFLAVSVCGLGYLAYRLDRHIRPAYLSAIEEDLLDTATLLAATLEVDAQGKDRLELDYFPVIVAAASNRPLSATIYDHTVSQLSLRIIVTDRLGVVAYDSWAQANGQDWSNWQDIKLTLAGKYGARATWLEGERGKTQVLHVAAPVFSGSNRIGVVSVSRPAVEMQAFLAGARPEVILALVLGSLLLILWAWLVSRMIAAPIRQLSRYAQAVRDGQTMAPPDLGSSELGDLARAFEQMRLALNGKLYVEDYVRSLTHEIKSPLTSIRGAAELIDSRMPAEKQERFLENIRQETKRIQRIIDRMLTLSALEARQGLQPSGRVNLVQLVAARINGAAPKLAEKSIEIRFCQDGAFPIEGDEFLLGLAVDNLLRNAIDFTPQKGSISIRFGQQALIINDSGPGIPDYAKNKVFSRFFSLPREPGGRKSSGLGLSIVRQVMRLHNGGAELRNGSQGGAEAILWFPVDSKKTAQPPQNEID